MKALFSNLVATDKRPATRRVRELLPQIEAAFAVGHKHAAIHDELVAQGIALSFKDYKRVLARLRKEAASRASTPSLPTASQGVGGRPSSPGAVWPSVVTRPLQSRANTTLFSGDFSPRALSAADTLQDTEQVDSKFNFNPKEKIDLFNRKEIDE